MSTHACIGLKLESYVRYVYLHWDGYLEWAGNMLLEHYNSYEKAKELFMLGNLSAIYEKVKPDEGEEHSFDKPVPNVTIAYHRDRNEYLYRYSLSISRTTNDAYIIQELCEKTGSKYVYLYDKKNGQWIFGTNGKLLPSESKIHPAVPGTFYPLQL